MRKMYSMRRADIICTQEELRFEHCAYAVRAGEVICDTLH